MLVAHVSVPSIFSCLIYYFIEVEGVCMTRHLSVYSCFFTNNFTCNNCVCFSKSMSQL